MQTSCLKLADRLEYVLGALSAYSYEFRTHGYCVIPDIFCAEEVRSLVDIWEGGSACRREIEVTYAGITSTRRLDTLSARSVDAMTPEVEGLYCDDGFVSFLSRLADEEIVPLEDELEKYVFNALSGAGDHHGEHFDSFPFACTIPLEQPRRRDGGRFEIRDPHRRGRLIDVDLKLGSLVFFRSSEIAHRVTCIGPRCRRLVLSLAYATPATSDVVSNTRELMYGED